MSDPMEQFGGSVHDSEAARRERAEARYVGGISLSLEINRLNAEIARLTAERDRALALLREASDALAPYAPGSKQGQCKARIDEALR